MITIEIKNAMLLAREQSFLARTFGSLVPDLIARKVDEEVARRLGEALAEHGVEAEIEVRRSPDAEPASPPPRTGASSV